MRLYSSTCLCKDHFSSWCFMNVSDKRQRVHTSIPACHSKLLPMSDINTHLKVNINKKNSDKELPAVGHSEKEPSGIPVYDAELSVKIKGNQSEMDLIYDDASCSLVDMSLCTIESVTSGNNDRNLNNYPEPTLALTLASDCHNISKHKLISNLESSSNKIHLSPTKCILNLPLNNNLNYNATNSILVLNATDHKNSSHFNFMKPKLILNSIADNKKNHCNTTKPNLVSNSVTDNNQNHNKPAEVSRVLNFAADNNKNPSNPTELELALNSLSEIPVSSTELLVKIKGDQSEIGLMHDDASLVDRSLHTTESESVISGNSDINLNNHTLTPASDHHNISKPKFISNLEASNNKIHLNPTNFILNLPSNNNINYSATNSILVSKATDHNNSSHFNFMKPKPILNSIADNNRNHCNTTKPNLVSNSVADSNQNHNKPTEEVSMILNFAEDNNKNPSNPTEHDLALNSPSGIPVSSDELSVNIKGDQSEIGLIYDDASLVDTSLHTIESVTSGNNDINLKNHTLTPASDHHNISKPKLISNLEASNNKICLNPTSFILNLPSNNNTNYNATNSILVSKATDYNNSSQYNFMKPKLILNSIADNKRNHCNTTKPNLVSNLVADSNQNHNKPTDASTVLNFAADNNKNPSNPTEPDLTLNSPSQIPVSSAELSVNIKGDQSEMGLMYDDTSCTLAYTSLHTTEFVTLGNNDINLNNPTEPNLALTSASNHHNILKPKFISNLEPSNNKIHLSPTKCILNLPPNNSINYNSTNSILVINPTDHNNSIHFNFMKPKPILNSVADNNRNHCNTTKPKLVSNSVADSNQTHNNSTEVNMVLNLAADNNKNPSNPTESDLVSSSSSDINNSYNPTEPNLVPNPAEDSKMYNSTKSKVVLNSEMDNSNCSHAKSILALNTVEDNNRNKYNFMKPKLILNSAADNSKNCYNFMKPKLILNSAEDQKSSIYSFIKPKLTLNLIRKNSKNHKPTIAKSILNSAADDNINHTYLVRPKLILKPAAHKDKRSNSTKMKLTRKLKRMLTSIQYAHLFQPIPHWCKRRILYRKVHYKSYLKM